MEVHRLWLGPLREDGFHYLSEPRRFAHDEAAYDSFHGNAELATGEGRGLIAMLRRMEADFEGPALEVGCGTGVLSLGLVFDSPYPLTVLTDPSPEFLRITERKIRAIEHARKELAYAVFDGDDIDQLPSGLFSLIAMRYTLHHVNDYARFIERAADALRVGGVLTFLEPCSEAFVVMGAIAQFLPKVAKLTEEQHAKVRQFVEGMSWYCRRDLDRSKEEDKHAFRIDEVMQAAHRCGLETTFYPNRGYGQLLHDRPAKPFRIMFRDYLQLCMGWGPEMMDLFDEHLGPACECVELGSQGGHAPCQFSVFVCRRAL